MSDKGLVWEVGVGTSPKPRVRGPKTRSSKSGFPGPCRGCAARSKEILPGAPKYVNHGPKPLKRAKKAIILHTFGV